MTEAEQQKLEAMTARMDALAVKMDLVCETPSVLAALEQLAEIEAAIVAGQERLAAITLKEAALTERAAVLDERERAIKVREFLFDQKRDEAMEQLRSNYLALVQSDRALKLRVLNFSGMLSGFDVGIMELPDWIAIEKMLGMTDAIPELRDTPTELTREDWSGNKFLEQSTLTRSMPMAEMASHDEQPMPKPPVRKRPSRGGFRAAYRRALAS